MKNIVLIDEDLVSNHWLLGGFFTTTDTSIPRRIQQLKMIRLLKERHPENSMFYFFLGLTPIVHLTDEFSAEALLKSQEHITKSYIYDFVVPWLGQGVLIATNKKWKSRRRILTPSFHYKILQNFSSSE